mgnify:CR=1 FL=1|tara:strand:- start:670 stop:879 length:210 start_codon:yes stop_codon:yes gene_type:complete
MPNQQSIKFTIRQDGTVTEEVIGATGDTCVTLTKELEDRLGVVERVEHKPEYYLKQTVSNTEDVTLQHD